MSYLTFMKMINGFANHKIKNKVDEQRKANLVRNNETKLLPNVRCEKASLSFVKRIFKQV